ncbi:MAG: OmpA family protein [Aldersonia sp.]|nr:OmpA family protein [Aldersonia sp.]
MSVTQNEPPQSGEAVDRRITTTTYTGRFPWLPLLLAVLIVPLVLAALAIWSGVGARDDIENDLTAESRQALTAAGYPQAQVRFDGRDATISGVSSADAAAAVNAVLGVDGVRDADISADGANAPIEPAPTVAEQATPQPTTTAAPPPFDRAALQQQIDAAIAESPISFVVDTTQLTASGAATVDEIASLLNARPPARVEIAGYVADTGASEESARSVSLQRANAVRDRMVGQGAAADRMTTVGLGTSNPIAGNDTAAGQAANRRVGIVVL